MIKLIVDLLLKTDAKLSASFLTINHLRYGLKKLSEQPLHSNGPLFTYFQSTILNFEREYSKLSWEQNAKLMASVISAYSEVYEENDGPLFSPGQEDFLRTHKPFFDIDSGEPLWWSLVERRPSKFSAKIASYKFMGKAQVALRDMAGFSEVLFEPMMGLNGGWESVREGVKIASLNAFRPPVWYKKNYQGVPCQENYPALFVHFVKSLFPVEAERGVLLDWMALALFERPFTMLHLRGMRGNGKTIFKHILFHLIGTFYEVLRKVSLDFNADLKQKRIIGLDDNIMIGTHDGYELRKILTNSLLSYQEKQIQTKKIRQTIRIVYCVLESHVIFLRSMRRTENGMALFE